MKQIAILGSGLVIAALLGIMLGIAGGEAPSE